MVSRGRAVCCVRVCDASTLILLSVSAGVKSFVIVQLACIINFLIILREKWR